MQRPTSPVYFTDSITNLQGLRLARCTALRMNTNLLPPALCLPVHAENGRAFAWPVRPPSVAIHLAPDGLCSSRVHQPLPRQQQTQDLDLAAGLFAQFSSPCSSADCPSKHDLTTAVLGITAATPHRQLPTERGKPERRTSLSRHPCSS